MKRRIRFVKATGAGNDFVIVDRSLGELPADLGGLARAVCARHFGIGADGLLVYEPAGGASFRMLYFNADGSTGGMCGNGARCLVRYGRLRRGLPDEVSFEALGHRYRAEVREGGIRVRMKNLPDPGREVALRTPSGAWTGRWIDTGAPHFVVLLEDLDGLDAQTAGAEIRRHEAFSPEGTNVDFASVAGPNSLVLRTYERGVERETQACGTGSVAAAVVAGLKNLVASPVTVRVRSGSILKVEFSLEGSAVRDVFLEGPGDLLFSGSMEYDADHAVIRDHG
ncbi:MAG: diaminopimelate epimerase [Bacteroidota bacterium]